MTPTQEAAWNRIRPTLAKSQAAVVGLLIERPSLTRNEIDRELGHGMVNAVFSRRLAELERMGVLSRGPVRACSVTGHPCETWVVTWEMPSKPPSGKARRSKRKVVESAFQTIASLLERPPEAPLLEGPTLTAIRQVVEKAKEEVST